MSPQPPSPPPPLPPPHFPAHQWGSEATLTAPISSTTHDGEEISLANQRSTSTVSTVVVVHRRHSSRRRRKRRHRFRRLPIWAALVSFVRSRMRFRPPIPHDPRVFSAPQKRWILACLALGGSLNGFCSTIYFPGLPAIAAEFEASDIVVTLTTSLFMLFGGFGPILWASMSDFYHVRRFLYLVSLLIFTGASAGCALSLNVYMLLVMRCVQSVGTSVTISVGAGTVADCWEVTERGAAFSILFVGQFIGPLIGPILGGGLTTALGWRSTFWFCAGYGIFLFTFLFFFLPETYRMEGMWDPLPEKPTNTAVESSLLQHDGSSDGEEEDGREEEEEGDAQTVTEGGRDDENGDNSDDDDDMYEGSIAPPPDPKTSLNPIKSVYLLRHLFVLLIAIETGSVFGTMFTIETIIPELFESTYGFVSWQTGLSYIGAGIGNVIGSFVAGALSDHFLKRARQKRGGIPKAEDRLTFNAWPGGLFLVPLGVLVFGWGLEVHWTVWVAIVAFGIVCFGMSQVYPAGQAYLVDSVPGQGASVAAASNVMRTGMACILSLVAQPVVNAIGSGYLSVVLAGLNLFGMLLFFIVKTKGQKLRRQAGYGDNQA